MARRTFTDKDALRALWDNRPDLRPEDDEEAESVMALVDLGFPVSIDDPTTDTALFAFLTAMQEDVTDYTAGSDPGEPKRTLRETVDNWADDIREDAPEEAADRVRAFGFPDVATFESVIEGWRHASQKGMSG